MALLWPQTELSAAWGWCGLSCGAPSPTRYRALRRSTKRCHSRRTQVATRAESNNLWERLEVLSKEPPHFGTEAAKDALHKAEKAFAQAQPLTPSVDFAQRISAAATSAERSLEAAAHSVQDSISQAAPVDLRFSLGKAASALRSVPDRLKLPDVHSPWSATAQQAATAASGVQTQVQDTAAALVQGLDRAQLQAQSALSELVPSLPLGPTAGFGRNAPPHFGTQAAVAAAQDASTWISGQVFRLEMTYPQARLIFRALTSQFQSATDFLQRSLLHPAEEVPRAAGQILSSGLDAVYGPVQSTLSAAYPPSLAAWLEAFIGGTQRQAAGIGAGYSPVTIAALAAAVALTLFYTAPRTDEEAAGASPVPEDVLATDYDPDYVAAYWARRPGAVSVRSLQVLAAALRFGFGVMLDAAFNRVDGNAPRRARQLRGELERLGPAYVKVAQAVSTRVDILSPEYLVEMELLQDRVPPFPTSQALAAIEAALGQPVKRAFTRISQAPVASASLGQVYNGVLSDSLGGAEVAVKVQRPHVLARVALDLFLMRWLAKAAQQFPQVSTDWVGLIDEWALRFFHELDYKREAQNSILFAEQMSGLQGITVSEVFPQLSTRNVLTTAWVKGEKLSESTASDVRALCNTLLNCYLIQLLETGFLHADPHPGNLLRTPDGRICILDFGMMTAISPGRSIALVEYISHLSVGDWESVARDLGQLGFTKPGEPDLVQAGVVAPLGRILEQLSRGGGARGVNIDQVTVELEALTKQYPFQIPSYFALILRCFSVIEGIALRVDPTYSIVQECFPYLARRLLTDDHPRTRAALRQLLYGNKTRLDVARLQRLTAGFASFTVSGLTTNGAPQGLQLNSTTRDALRVVFSSRGSYVQEVVVEEAVAAVDAAGREALSEFCSWILGAPATAAALAGLRAMGPLRPLLLPLPTPLELLSRLAPAVAVTPEDEEALDVARSLLQVLGAGRQPSLDLDGIRRFLGELAPLLPELLPGFAYTSELFVRALIRRIALRIADESRPRPLPERAPAGAAPAHRTQMPGAMAMQGNSQGMFDSPNAALRAVFGLLLPQNLPVQQRSSGWHAQRRSK